jgi:IS30 family transposase
VNTSPPRRQEFGHWEGDLLQFRTQRGNLLTLIERITRLTLAAPLKTKTAEATDRLLRAIFRRLPLLARRSITFDNGSEFARHQNLSQTLDMKTWFCDPHSPWQRGSIENANGVLRRDLPRKTDLADYSQQDIHDIVWAINTTPRKCLLFPNPRRGLPHSPQVLHLICESSPSCQGYGIVVARSDVRVPNVIDCKEE